MGRNRVRVSVTVDPRWLGWVDRYVDQHPETDRSKVFDEALYLWCAKQQELAMVEQYAPGGDPPKEEYEAWRRIRNAAALRLFWPEPTKVDQ